MKITTKRNKAILVELIKTDFKLRYQGSVLGYVWALLKPLFLFAILYAVFGLVLRFGDNVPNFPVYLLLGVVLWGFFTDATKQGLSSIVSRGELIRKIQFPNYIIVIAATTSALINLCFNLLVVSGFVILSGAEVQWYALLLAPVLIIELYGLSLAIAFFLSVINVRYRDISYIWDILLQGGFYASAIFFPLSLIAERSLLAAQAIALTPVSQIIQDLRFMLVTSETANITSLTGSFFYRLVPLAFLVLITLLAVSYFKKRSRYFAEDI